MGEERGSAGTCISSAVNQRDLLSMVSSGRLVDEKDDFQFCFCAFCTVLHQELGLRVTVCVRTEDVWDCILLLLCIERERNKLIMILNKMKIEKKIYMDSNHAIQV